MGVPRLYKWISEMCSNSIRTKRYGERSHTVDHLLIDSNAIIHEFTQKIFNYGAHKRMLPPRGQLTYDQKILKVYQLTFEKIVEIAKVCVPTKSLFIGFDGVAPAGKMAQQRQRRFIATLSNGNTEFNPNCISPGTEFMNGIRSYFYDKLLDLKTTLSVPLIVFSSSDVGGEGEHKALEYMRYHTSPTDSNAIFGPDGDLIMLTLGTRRTFTWLRDDLDSNFFINIVDIDMIRQEIEKVMPIEDFVLLGFFVGNDFLPKLQLFYFLEDGMKHIFEVYKQCGKRLINGGNIDYDVLLQYCVIVNNYEKDLLESQCKVLVTDEKFRNRTLDECYNGDVLDYDKYVRSYHTKTSFTPQVVQDYITGLEWVYNYYMKGPTNYSFCYQHHYAPLMIDIVQHFSKPLPLKKDKPHSPIEQLLAILPEKSKSLVPSQFHSIYKDLPEFYPTYFEIDYEGKYKDYQGIALLSFVDFDKIREYAKSYQYRKGYTLFYRSCEHPCQYKTKYRDLVQTCVKITILED